ncbi:FAD-dependent oxidoreductase [Novosphingobium sp. TH158]|uniref:FAD-dependent oxidoreductase n=1 Tax=Novosphingobium sp. TH158 TaxID=2067455 RepID=UPI000C7B4F6B|nr:FAD-dependent oxidoreductase [Novosphingobium sp. TH158]PLK26290.1 3-ketosteroid-delta-1-dehydrogenase [Novosphingobium sp. TH158]
MSGFDETFDWVVVGSGAGSMSSAMVMRKAGKTAVILEKMPVVGGTTAKSGGVMWIPNNRFMTDADESPQKAITYLDAVTNEGTDAPGTSHEKRVAYVNESPKMLDFIVGQGVTMERATDFWPDYYDDLPGGCKTTRCVTAKYFNTNELGEWKDKLAPGCAPFPAKLEDGMKVLNYAHKSWAYKWLFAKIAVRVVMAKITGRNYTSSGAALQGRMLKAALATGVDIRVNSPVKDFIVEGGKVVGVVAEIDGKTRRIGANLGVLVNAGGFAQNQAMRDKYMPGTKAEWSNVPMGDTGDLFGKIEELGGVMAQMDQMVGYQSSLTPGFEKDFVKPGGQGITGKPGAILVDHSGVRYLNEGGSYELYCQRMIERNRTVPAVPSWAVFDQNYLENYKLHGKWQKTAEQRKALVDAGYLKVGNTIEELAAQISVDPAVLKATIERWNGFVDKGVDEDFGRGGREYDKWLGDPFNQPNPSLGRIDKGPFFAINIIPSDVSTYGGAIIDAKARVLKADGEPIPGLYACGVSTASIMGGVYPGAGASVGPSMTFGYIAAKHAAGVDNSL